MQHISIRPTVEPSRRDIDIAIGILIAVRGYSERDAFDELVSTVQRTGEGISRVARALIALVRDPDLEGSYPIEALQIWGQLKLPRTTPGELINRRRSGGSPGRALGPCR